MSLINLAICLKFNLDASLDNLKVLQIIKDRVFLGPVYVYRKKMNAQEKLRF